MTGVDVAAVRARLRAAVDQRWVRFYSAAQCADHIRTETTREWVAQFAATPHIAEFIAHAPTDIRALLDALAVAEQQRDDALAVLARVEAMCNEYGTVTVRVAQPTSTPTAETVPPRVAGTGGPQNPAQSRGSAE